MGGGLRTGQDGMTPTLDRGRFRGAWHLCWAGGRYVRAAGADGRYELRLTPVRGGELELTLKRDKGKGARQAFCQRFATEAEALRERRNLLTRVVEIGR
jgi:hypothetical protein